MREAVLMDAPYIIGDQSERLEEPRSVLPQISPRAKQRLKVNRLRDLFGNDGATGEQAEYALPSVSHYLWHRDAQPCEVGNITSLDHRSTATKSLPKVCNPHLIALDIVMMVAGSHSNGVAKSAT